MVPSIPRRSRKNPARSRLSRMTRRLALCLFIATLASAQAQGTKLWTVGRYDEMEHGSTDSAAIRSDGRIETGPANSLLATTGSNYVWTVAPGPNGSSYAGVGGSTQGSAALLRIAPDGKSTKLFSGPAFSDQALAVQSLKVAPDGTLFFATSPDGKLYRLAPNASAPTILFDPSTTADKPKYIWDLALVGTDVYVATGAPAALYRIPTAAPAATPQTPILKTADQHIRCLAVGQNGTLWLGTDGAGVIYRLDTTHPNAKPFAAYAAPRREITSLVVAPDGSVYAAGVGSRGPSNLPPLPVTGAVGVTVTFLAPGSATAAGANAIVPDGSEIYRIAPDGAPSRIATFKDDVIYALALREGALIAATGNRGRLYRIDLTGKPPGEGLATDLVHVEAGQATALASAPDGSLLVATGNGGKLFRVAPGTAPTGTYTSEVFDARQFTHFGRAEVRADSHGYDLYLRTGNVPTPLEGWSDWRKITPGTPPAATPDARFAQWKAVLSTGGTLDGVAINYLPRNLAPVVDEVYVQPGARANAPTPPAANQTIQVQYPPPTPSTPSDNLSTPLAAQRDRTAVTIRWAAHDDNGDDLMFAVYSRGDGESTWHLLKDKLSDHFLSFDAALLPDGNYRLKVVASDAPDHTDADTLTAERVSDPFLIDTTPPIPGPLQAALAAGRIHATFEAHDALTPIAHAEYSIDAGDWQYLEPIGKISDSLTERYDFTAPLPHPEPTPTEHTLAVRVYDRSDNAVTVKTLVHP
jgi:outer membrane protein assembly factor BamB